MGFEDRHQGFDRLDFDDELIREVKIENEFLTCRTPFLEKRQPCLGYESCSALL